MFFVFKQKTAYEMRISDWSSDVCSSDLGLGRCLDRHRLAGTRIAARRCLALRNREGAEADQANLVALLERTRNRIEHGLDRFVGVAFAETRRIGHGADQFLDRKSTRLNSSH